MNITARTTTRTLGVAVRAMVVFTVVLGVAYTLLITFVGQLAFPAQAQGSLLRDDAGRVVGSSLIGQAATSPDGAPLPEYFQPRPSAAGDGYDGANSYGSNHGPENADLIAAIAQRRAQIAAFEGVDPADVPPDALTASGSGLDPHISPEYAAIQVARVAQTRGVDAVRVRELVAENTRGRDLGYLGEPAVNVVELNLALDRLGG